ncbi:hypothetical protein EYF80_002867 [Liparis tanakae]|uniref:Uncharacterized protein n=1 Tax=Liparis tanakae TaxID=230148 RepID=A0A4Z2JCT0_9TELE|nr:hypothetical protein EYF80_002867 [Liparis tanakae]
MLLIPGQLQGQHSLGHSGPNQRVNGEFLSWELVIWIRNTLLSENGGPERAPRCVSRSEPGVGSLCALVFACWKFTSEAFGERSTKSLADAAETEKGFTGSTLLPEYEEARKPASESLLATLQSARLSSRTGASPVRNALLRRSESRRP